MVPIRPGDESDAVFDLQRRLVSAGYDVGGEHRAFGPHTESALRRFQRDRRLVVDGVCGVHTWEALIDAEYQLGDRLLYLREPPMSGDDVTELQHLLARLGFSPDRHDGSFGADTAEALTRFQQDYAVLEDGMLGGATLEALRSVARNSHGGRTVTEVLERERLRQQPRSIQDRRIAIGGTGEVPAIAQAVSRHLRRAGAEVLVHGSFDTQQQARASNEWEADAYLGIALVSEHFSVSYFETKGFVSAGGMALAGQCAQALEPVLPATLDTVGMRLPILRATRMPATWCRLGPAASVVTKSSEIARALAAAVTNWCAEPVLADTTSP